MVLTFLHRSGCRLQAQVYYVWYKRMLRYLENFVYYRLKQKQYLNLRHISWLKRIGKQNWALNTKSRNTRTSMTWMEVGDVFFLGILNPRGCQGFSCYIYVAKSTLYKHLFLLLELKCHFRRNCCPSSVFTDVTLHTCSRESVKLKFRHTY